MLLVYSIIDEQSFTEMGRWLMELRDNLGDDGRRISCMSFLGLTSVDNTAFRA